VTRRSRPFGLPAPALASTWTVHPLPRRTLRHPAPQHLPPRLRYNWI